MRIRQVDISKLLGTMLRHKGRCSISVTVLQQRRQRVPDAASHAGGGHHRLVSNNKELCS